MLETNKILEHNLELNLHVDIYPCNVDDINFMNELKLHSLRLIVYNPDNNHHLVLNKLKDDFSVSYFYEIFYSLIVQYNKYPSEWTELKKIYRLNCFS